MFDIPIIRNNDSKKSQVVFIFTQTNGWDLRWVIILILSHDILQQSFLLIQYIFYLDWYGEFNIFIEIVVLQMLYEFNGKRMI